MNYVIKPVGQNTGLATVQRLVSGQSLYFGSTAMADVRLDLPPHMPGLCVEVTGTHSGCVARNLCDASAPVTSNGQPIAGAQSLLPGDCFEVGDYQFQILAAEPAQPESTAQTSGETLADEVAAPEIQKTVSTKRLNSVVAVHTPQSLDWTLPELLNDLFENASPILLANFKSASIDHDNDLPEGVEVSVSDMFESAPEEITQAHSLHVISAGPVAGRVEIAGQLMEKDAGVVAIPADSLDQCLEEFKLHAAWFSRPSVLAMFLKDGSTELAGKLLKPFRCIVLPSTEDGEGWSLFSSVDFSLEEILPEALIVGA